MTYTPRIYQAQAIDQILAASEQRLLYVLPTGGGKTCITSHVAHNYLQRGLRVLVLQHRKRLIRQACDAFSRLGHQAGIIQAGVRPVPELPLQVASIDTLARRLSGSFDLVIADEGHHAPSTTWARVLEYYNSGKQLLVTATPCRMDGRGLQDFADRMILGPSAQWLTDQGFLAPMTAYGIPLADTKTLRTRGGEFDQGQAAELLTNRAIVGDAVRHYLDRVGRGGTVMSFCCTVSHAEEMAEVYRQHGINAAAIHGGMPVKRQDALFQQLQDGELHALMSCQLVDEGVDAPMVDGIQLLAPTQSLRRYLQRVGRGLRPHEGKHKVLLDHVGDMSRHGHHLEERQWSLDSPKRKRKDPCISVRECVKCFAAMPSHSKACPECGEVQPVPPPKPMKYVNGELVEITPAMARTDERKRCRTYDDLLRLAVQRGYRHPAAWARHVVGARHRR